MCVTHSRIGRLFGEDEEQLAQFITTLAGAAWENAEGFSRVEQAVRARDDFLAIASHELKTPLTPLQLQLDSLRRTLNRAGMKDPPVRSSLEMMDRQVERLTNLVQSLLDVARIAGGRLELQPEDLDLGELVREVAQRFTREAEHSGSKLEVTTDSPLPLLRALGSHPARAGGHEPADQRHQIWRGQADRHAGQRPPRTSSSWRSRTRESDCRREDAARIFRRFERAVSSRFYGGLGLGLYITRQIIEAHGGHISVRSAPGQGSTFTVTLPRSANPGVVMLRPTSETPIPSRP